MAEAFELHEMVYFNGLRLTYAIDVVSGEVHKHDMLSTIFF